jgi:hypothetical protein
MANTPKDTNEINITAEEAGVGAVDELPPRDKARLALAGRVLLGLFLTMLIALAAVLFAPACRLAEAKEFLSFVKTLVPPLVTLVLGFYFNAQSEGG